MFCKTSNFYREITLGLCDIQLIIHYQMASYVYLIQNGDLYNIGFTNNLDKTRIDLKPGELLASLRTDTPESVIRNLRNIYINNRVPGSNYYRLGQSQVKECKLFLEEDGGTNYFQPFLRGGRLFLFFTFSWIIISYIIIQFIANPIFNKFN